MSSGSAPSSKNPAISRLSSVFFPAWDFFGPTAMSIRAPSPIPDDYPLRLLFDQFTACATEEVFDEVGGINATPKIRVLQDRLLEWNGRLNPGDHVFRQRPAHLVHGFPPVFSIRDQDRKSTRLNSSHVALSRMPSSA